ncbi:MAG: DUF952 domain-containing protein [Elusimicrobia bacterium]|nr:DUF952 domain-containing protein [Elusimicrobiota bacterium]
MVYKLLRPAEWDSFRRDGRFDGSEHDRRDGFIHLSAAGQLAGTAAKHFVGEPELVLAEVDPAPLRDALRWEPSRGGALFPHLYGSLPLEAVRRTWAVRDGILPSVSGCS